MALIKFFKISRYSSEFSLRLDEKIESFATKIFAQRVFMRTVAIIFLFCIPSFASAAIFINEVQISPIKERFIELYNSDSSDVDLTGWYIQRKTASLGAKFGSLVTSTQLNGKIIKAQSYFLISRSQLYNSDVVVDLTLTESNILRIRDSKGKDVDEVLWGSIDDGKSYQRTPANSWLIGAPTPGAENSVSQNVNTATVQTSSANVAPTTAHTTATAQVTAQAGPQTRVVLAGAPIIFEGKVAGLENSNSTTQTTWSFGDGASAEGESVAHTYYYPGEYTAVLDVVSGSLKATDKMLVRVVLPNLLLKTGGDFARSFFTIENRGGDELDISGWQVAGSEKTFIFPKNTILGARKSATFASEVTGLVTPADNIPELRFPNGMRVDTKVETAVAQPVAPKQIVAKAVEKPKVTASAPARVVTQAPKQQSANVIDVISEPLAPIREERGLWPWYVGSAFLGALALLGLRLTQKEENKATINADDFEIIEETDDGEPR